MVYGRRSTDDARRTHNGRRTKTDHNSSPRAFGSGELNIVSALSLKNSEGKPLRITYMRRIL